jgi:hypothetical protein
MALTTFSGPVKSDNGFIGAFTSTQIVLQSNNSNTITLDAPNGLAASYSLIFPPNDGTNGQALITDGSGVTSWSSVGSFTTLTATSVDVTNTSSSTSLFEPVVVSSTLTGVGVTGGRSKFATTINAAAGSFSNALKADVTYGASGSTTGLGSAFVAEMTLSAGTSAGTYAPLELELNLPSGAATGTLTSFIHASMQGAGVATMDTNGRFINIVGVTAGAGKMWKTGTTLGTAAGGLRCRIAGTDYWLPMYAAEPTA